MENAQVEHKKPSWIMWVALITFLLFMVWGATRIMSGISGGMGFSALSFLLIAGGIGLASWSKVPAVGKSLGGQMLTAGVLLAVLVFVFSDNNVEGWRQYLQQKTTVGADGRPLSPEAQVARLAREKQETELATQRAAAAAASQEAAKIAAEKVRIDALMPAKAGPCFMRYTDQLNCETVVFGLNSEYNRRGLPGHCLVADPQDAVKRTDLGGGQYRYQAPRGLTVQFFDLPIGQKIGTFTCGG